VKARLTGIDAKERLAQRADESPSSGNVPRVLVSQEALSQNAGELPSGWNVAPRVFVSQEAVAERAVESPASGSVHPRSGDGSSSERAFMSPMAEHVRAALGLDGVSTSRTSSRSAAAASPAVSSSPVLVAKLETSPLVEALSVDVAQPSTVDKEVFPATFSELRRTDSGLVSAVNVDTATLRGLRRESLFAPEADAGEHNPSLTAVAAADEPVRPKSRYPSARAKMTEPIESDLVVEEPHRVPVSPGLRSRAVLFQTNRFDTELPTVALGGARGSLNIYSGVEVTAGLLPEVVSDSAHADCVTAISGDLSQTFATASLDRMVRVWRVCGPHLECLGELQGHTGSVRTLLADIQNDQAVSAAMDGTLRLWKLGLPQHNEGVADWECACILQAPSTKVTQLLASYRDNCVAAVAHEGRLMVWDIERQTCLNDLVASVGSVFAVQIGKAAETRPSQIPGEARRRSSFLLPKLATVSRTGGSWCSRSIW